MLPVLNENASQLCEASELHHVMRAGHALLLLGVLGNAANQALLDMGFKVVCNRLACTHCLALLVLLALGWHTACCCLMHGGGGMSYPGATAWGGHAAVPALLLVEQVAAPIQVVTQKA
jgi:hypothetical protein